MINLNVVSLDVPYPPDYGGVIDIFYKLRALYQIGVRVHLHCYEYDRPRRDELNRYCETVRYYRRKTGMGSNLSSIPYIIYSRRDRELLGNLQRNDYPIVFEGLHSLYPVLTGGLPDRTVLLRSHNIEHDYYRRLAQRETNVVKQAYFYKEAYLLARTLRKLPASLPIAAISPSDTDYLSKRFPKTFWLPPFHSNDELQSRLGSGKYALYHGNLSVSENTEVAEVLIRQFANREVRLIVAGKEPPGRLVAAAESASNIDIIRNPGAAEMDTLIQEAHVILLPTYQPTGIKLKLIESLYRGRHCIANRPMVENTRLEDLVILEEENFYQAAVQMMLLPFLESDRLRREAVLKLHYSNLRNARKLLATFYPTDGNE
jgi:hypothetical protein